MKRRRRDSCSDGRPRRRSRKSIGWAALLSLVTLLFWSACGPGAATPGGDAGAPIPDTEAAGFPGVLKVVTTVSPITSIVENIGGPRIQLEGIVPEGVNSHTFAPAPSVALVIAQADLIVLNGLLLEEPTLAMAEANRTPTRRSLAWETEL